MTPHPILGALGAAVLSLLPAASLAHAVLERPDGQAGSTYRGVIQITHGCGSSPTTSVTVTVPEGAIGARPLAKPGWSIATKRGPYSRSYPYFHGAISEGVKEITWSGGTLPGDFFDEFVFSVRLSDAFKPGDTVYFSVEQVCASGQHRWVEIPAAGQDPHALASPAPGLRIVAAAAGRDDAAPAAAAVTAGDLTIEQAWMRATPNGAKVAGGYLRITNRGKTPDRLLSASLPRAARGEVHEMTTEGGIMKMHPVEGGLAIPPGATVELKPGGYHLMFMDLRSGVQEGEVVQGSVTFEKAGIVALTFTAAGIGARGPAIDHSRH